MFTHYHSLIKNSQLLKGRNITVYSITVVFFLLIFIGYTNGQEVFSKFFTENPVPPIPPVPPVPPIPPVKKMSSIQSLPETPSDFEESDKKPVPSVECIRTFRPPVIDGKLTDTSWIYAGKIENFIWANGIDQPHIPTEAFLLWDNEYFYIGVKCYETRMDKIKISKTQRDSSVWEDDVVEVFIDPKPGIPGYYHLIVNPIATIFDKINKEPRKPIEWDSQAKVNTSITSDFWLIEMAIPHSSTNVKPTVGDEWRFNLHRKEQRREEYTYWSPTYDKNYSWPHVPERFGILRLSVHPSERKTSEVTDEITKVLDIEVTGNEVVSAEKIVDILGLKISEHLDKLNERIESLKSTGWFEDVSLSIVKYKEGTKIIIDVIEKQLVSVNDIRIKGAELFSPDNLADYFGLYPTIMSVDDIYVKCRLMEQLHKYNNCSVIINRDFEEDTLVINMDTKKKTTGISIPCKGVEYPIQDFSFPTASKPFTFNRVRGWTLGAGLEAKSTYERGGARIYGGFDYGFAGEEWNYQFGLEPWLFNKHKLSFGIDVHRITQIRDESIMPYDAEYFIASAILGKEYRNYYQREGYELSLSQKITTADEFSLKFRDNEYYTLFKNTNWSLFNNDEIKRENLPIDDGRMRSIIVSYEFDYRNKKKTTERHFQEIPIPCKDTTNGWKGEISFEYAKSPLEAELNEEFDFTVFRFDVTRYNRLSPNQFLDLRLKGGIADNPLPLQYKFYLGGIGTLRGYEFQEFADGDKMILANVEYKITLGRIITPIIFVDTGYVWRYGDKVSIDELKTNVGIGLRMAFFRVNIAKSLETGREPVITVRLQRTF